MTKSSYTIGVVTDHGRFETHFKPLIESLVHIFPDREVLCVINGYSDKTSQISYLDKVTKFLSKFPTVRYLTNDIEQPLTKCWNQLVILSHADKIVILSGNAKISDLFRERLELNIDKYGFATINHSLKNFIISKDVIRKVGWFEERESDIGKDNYKSRLTRAGIPLENIQLVELINLHTDTEINISDPDVDNLHAYSPIKDADIPLFYDLSVLDADITVSKLSAGDKKGVVSIIKKPATFVTDKTKQFIKKIKEARPPI